MSYIYSLIAKTTDVVVAPIKVAYDKTKEVLVSQSIISESTELTEPTESTESTELNESKKIVNVDGSDNKNTSKIIRRFNPPTNFFTSYAYFFSNPTKVDQGLYLGSAYNAACWYTLEHYNIKYVVNVTSEIDNYYQHCGITYYRISIKDDNNESIKPHFESSFEKIDEFLNKKDGNVLVHCYMGASRSATIVAHYLAKKTESDVTDVIDVLIQKRPIVNPTHKLITDLINIKT